MKHPASYIIAKKGAKMQSHIASLKMHRTHAHHKFQQNGFAPAHRNLLPHIATRNLRSHIASHALDYFLISSLLLIMNYLLTRHDLRCAVASCDVRVRTHFAETCDVRVCGAFLGLRCAIATSQVFQQ